MASRPLTALGLVALLVTAGCLGTAAPDTAGAAAAETGDSTPSISVTAAGSVALEPDLAVVTIAAEATADSADAARAQVADDVAAVRAALAGLDLDDDAVTTAYYRIDPQYDHTRESRELVGYRAVHALTVDADVDQAGAVIDAAVGAGAVRVDAVRFTLTDERRQSAREQALAVAMSNAAADADAIAAAADLSIDGVRSVSTGAPSVSPVDGRVAFAEGDSSTAIDAGPVTVTAGVQVVYSVG